MKRTLLILLTIAIAVCLAFSQGKVTRQKSTKTEQTQQSADKRKSNAEAKRRKEAEEAKHQQEAEEKRRQEEEARLQQEELKRQQEEKLRLEEEKNKKTGVINGHEWVDLGLPSGIKWATCNVYASNPWQYGVYFAWGELSLKGEYKPENGTMYDKNKTDLQLMGVIDSAGCLMSSYDAANVNWGGSWRMPTKEECQELIDKCEWKWTAEEGVKGYRITGPSGKSIFLPAAGSFNGFSLQYADISGLYWTSTSNDADKTFILGFNSGNRQVYSIRRDVGRPIRAVSN